MSIITDHKGTTIPYIFFCENCQGMKIVEKTQTGAERFTLIY